MGDYFMTAYLISCSDHYDHRLHVLDECLKSHGYSTVYITSDFDHTSKNKFKCNIPDSVQISAMPYKKNLSLSRILSHRKFSKDVFEYIENLKTAPDIIAAIVPPNFITYYGAKYKKKHPKCKLIFDIFDMWPETFPGGKIKKLLFPVFKIWAEIRNKNLNKADFVTTECELFRSLLKLPDKKSQSVYLCKERFVNKGKLSIPENQINLCYLGSINNIIGIEDICELIKRLSLKTKVELHIIGKGEKEEEFIASAKQAGAEVIFYGAVYDDDKKQDIINKCHYGLNIMKSSVCIGLTMKSIDYFRHGIPIINNIPADTQNLVESEKIGIQLNENTSANILSISNQENIQMRQQVDKVFAEKFEKTVVLKQYDDIFSKL